MLSTKILSVVVGNSTSESDPYFSNVSLLLHMDGTNGSQSIIDSSGSPKTVTASGNAQLLTSDKKFGTASCYMDGSGDYLSVSNPPSSLIDWYSSDFTVEMFVKPLSFTGCYYSDSGIIHPTLIGNRVATSNTNYWAFGIISNTGQVGFFYYSGSLLNSSPASTETVSLNTWNHVAMVKQGSYLKIFVNGSSSVNFLIQHTPIVSSSTPLVVCAGKNTFFKGFIDDVRITSGVARYASNFTPPTSPFPDQ